MAQLAFAPLLRLRLPAVRRLPVDLLPLREAITPQFPNACDPQFDYSISVRVFHDMQTVFTNCAQPHIIVARYGVGCESAPGHD